MAPSSSLHGSRNAIDGTDDERLLAVCRAPQTVPPWTRTCGAGELSCGSAVVALGHLDEGDQRVATTLGVRHHGDRRA